jgi:hypothetical protein
LENHQNLNLSTLFPCYVKFFLQLCYHLHLNCRYHWSLLNSIFSFHGSFDYLKFFLWILHLWQLFSGKWWLFYWLKGLVRGRNKVGLLCLNTVQVFFLFISYSRGWRDSCFISKPLGKPAIVFLHLSQILCPFWIPRTFYYHPVQHRSQVFLRTCTVTGIQGNTTMF